MDSKEKVWPFPLGIKGFPNVIGGAHPVPCSLEN